jgi:hypothetical protein
MKALLACVFVTATLLASGCSDTSQDIQRGKAAPDDPAGRIEAILRETDELRRVADLADLLTTLPPEALESVRGSFERVFFDRGDTELALFANWWARFDPIAAFYWSQYSFRGDYPRVKAAVVRAWARRDPQAAAGASNDPRFRAFELLQLELMDSVVVGWFESGEPGLVEYVAGIEEIRLRMRALRALTRARVLRDGPEESLRWAQAQPDLGKSFKLNLLQRWVMAAAAIDPEFAAAQAEGLIEGRGSQQMLSIVADSWVRWGDPGEALKYLTGLEAKQAIRSAVGEAMQRWYKSDPEAALAWIRDSPPGPLLDVQIAVVGRSLRDRVDVDWPSTLALLTRIERKETRESLMTWAVAFWLVDDEPSAEAWLAAGHDMPDDLGALAREKITENVRRRRQTLREGQALDEAEALKS